MAVTTTTKVAVPKYGSINKDGSINRFDPNTGKSTAPTSGSSLGKTYTDSQGQQFFSSDLANASSQKYVKASEIQPTTEPNFPQPNQPIDYTGLLQGANMTQTNPATGVIGSPTGITVKPVDTQTEQPTSSSFDSLKEMLGLAPKKQNVQAEIMKSQQYRQVEEARQQVQNYTNQLNGIQTKLQADQLSVTGQGRGIPEAIIGGQQAQLSKEAAIQSLPIQALLASSQGMMDIAQRHLDDLYKLRTEEINNDYDYRKQVFAVVANYIEKQDQRAYDAVIKDADRKYEEKTNLEKTRAELLSNAVSRGASQSYVTAINNATDLAGVVRAAGKYNTSATEAASIANTYSMINERGASKETATPEQRVLQLAQTEQSINDIGSLVQSPYIRSAVGPTKLGRFVGQGLDKATGERQNYIATVEKLRSQLSLDSLINAKAKGATFGALSDTEMRILAASASKLGTWAKTNKKGEVTAYSASEKEFKKELDKINNFAKLDFVLKGGDPMAVGIQIMPDGSYVVKNSDGTYTEL